MNILHTEASTGWGGQEMRILAEAEGMRRRGHQLFFAVQKGARLAEKARAAGFVVYEFSFSRKNILFVLWKLRSIIRKHQISHINTHSSKDAWLGGLAGRLSGIRIIRTRHLSTTIRCGLNSRLLYSWLADYTVTTCEEVAKAIRQQANIPDTRCSSIPTGVRPEKMIVSQDAIADFRQKWGIKPTDRIVGTVCVLRSWKGIQDLLGAAKRLQHHPHLKWVIVGSGSDTFFRNMAQELGLEGSVIFTGHMDDPYPALATFDIFTLLSTANEGVSQASLQAAYLEKPLITTSIGGLPEVCVEGETGFVVPIKNPDAVVEKVIQLINDAPLRSKMGKAAKALVLNKFTLETTLDGMESVYRNQIK